MSGPTGSSEAKMPAFTPPKPWNITFRKESYLPTEVMNIGEMQIQDRARGRFIFRCSCEDCNFFYRRGEGMRCVNLHTIEVIPSTPPPPPYSYMGLVKSIRAAAADREEMRDEKRRVQRELAMAAAAAAAAALSPKKGNPLKDQSKRKNLHKTMKRRRQ